MPKKPTNSKKAPQKKGASSLLAPKKATKSAKISTKKSAGLKKSSSTKFKNKKQAQKRLDTQRISELEANPKPKKTWKFWQKWSIWRTYQAWRRDFLSRRPHRSFRLTPRQHNQRSLGIRGYIVFSMDVWRTMWQNRRFFVGLFLITLLAFIVLSLLSSQSIYTTLRDALGETLENNGVNDTVYQAFLLSFTSLTSSGLGQTQDILFVFLSILLWLTIIYFLRHRLAGEKVKLSDSFYRSPTPLITTLFMGLVMAVQSIPLILYVIIFATARETRFINGGAGEMLAVFAGIFIGALVLYWIVGTLIAMMVVSNPGTKPLQALQVADDLVLGRRNRIVLRLMWHLLQTIMFWAVTLLPIVMLENYLAKHWEWLNNVPVVPTTVASLTIISLMWSTTYIYLLYRKVLDDQSSPA